MKTLRIIILGIICTVFYTSAITAQQPQTSTAPIYAVNSKFVNGVAPGYYPTKGAGLVLNIGAGTAICNGQAVTYAGGTLTMANGATNYVYLHAQTCAPAVGTTAFSVQQIPIAQVVTSGGLITTIADYRTAQTTNPKIGYFATAGAGFTLNIAAGSIFCDGTLRTYTASTLTMAASQTNYVYLDPSVNCIPAVGTTIWDRNLVPIATVVTNGSAITTVTDTRNVLNYKATVMTGNAPISVVGTAISCNNCAVAANALAKGSIIGGARSNAAGGAGTAANGYWWKSTSTGSTGCPGAFLPIGGYIRNVTLTTTTTMTAGTVTVGTISLDCMAAANAFSLPGGALAKGGDVAGVFTDSIYEYRVGSLSASTMIFDRKGTTGTAGLANSIMAEFVADGGALSLLGNSTENPLVGITTSYVAPFYNGGHTTEANVSFPIPTAGTLQYFLTSCTNANGAGVTTNTVRLNGAASAITHTIASSGVAGPWFDFTNTVAVVAGDRIAFQWSNASNITTCTPGHQVVVFSPTNLTSSIIGWNVGGNSAGTTATYIQPLASIRDATELNVGVGMPRDGVAGNLYVYLPSAVAAGTLTFTLMKNGATTALTCGLTSGSGSGAVLCDTTHTVAYLQRDTMSLKYQTSTGTVVLAGAAITFD